MSSRTIIVLCPHGRRQTVKASLNTSLLEVLEEACRKQGIKPEDYDISHYNKPLDLSLSVRFANLPNNAMLELNPTKNVRQEGFITICLQLESGERLTDEFSPSSSLWDVIQKCNSNQEQDESQGEPVCIYMRQRIIGDDIKTTTLRNLGLTGGKAIIRLMYRQPETLNEQAHVSLPITKPIPFKTHSAMRRASTSSPDFISKQMRLDDTLTMDEERRIDTENTENEFTESNKAEIDTLKQDSQYEPMQLESSSCVPDFIANDSNSKISLPMELEIMDIENGQKPDQPPKKIGAIIYIGKRNAVLFSLEDICEVRKVDMPDEFFELTVDDIRYLMHEFKRERSEMENVPLMLKSQRDARLLQQLSCYKQTVIRIYFPNKLVLQGTFIADEIVQAVWDFVRNFLEDKDLNFYLYITPPKTKLLLEKTLLHQRLVPAAVIHFGCDIPRVCYLHPEIRCQISDPRAATEAAATYSFRKQKPAPACNEKPMMCDQILKESTENVAGGSASNSSSVSEGQRYVPPPRDIKTPKWFKFGKQ